jgi:RHS repeat-associated protein
MRWQNRRRVRRRASRRSFIYNLRFPGQYYLPESGLFSNGFRDCYDPQTGRYCESDPIGLGGGSYSTYVYVANNPIQFIDPFGRDLTVTLYQGRADHIGIGVNSPLTYGFYPAADAAATLLDINVPGIEKPDAGEIPIDSITIHTDPQQDAAVQAFIKDRMKNPGKYNLYHRNCATTVESALSSANLSSPNDTLPKSLFDWLKQKYPPHGPSQTK